MLWILNRCYVNVQAGFAVTWQPRGRVNVRFSVVGNSEYNIVRNRVDTIRRLPAISRLIPADIAATECDLLLRICIVKFPLRVIEQEHES